MLNNLIYKFQTLLFISILIFMLSTSGCSISNTPEEELEWCLRNKPTFNSSIIDGIQTKYKIELGKVQQKCFTQHWEEYCKVSYPEYCPQNNFSDYDRCIRNCISYGTEDCPC